MSETLKIAVCQMTTVDDVEQNYLQIEKLVSETPAQEGVRLFCFPENCLYLRIKEGEAIPPFTLEHEVFKKLANLAKSRKAFLHLGSVPMKLGDFLYNSSVLISDFGVLETKYQKIHLFDIQLSGQKSIRESDMFKHGDTPSLFEVDGWKIAQSICYDLRFAELYSRYAREQADLILVPSAFLVKTGEAHWEVLLRARAIESQCYVVASAQAGKHQSTRSSDQRETYGNSLVVEPWGSVMMRLSPNKTEVSVAALSKEKITQVRTQIPMAEHRRLSVK